MYLYLTYQLPTRNIAGDPGIKVMPYAYGILTSPWRPITSCGTGLSSRSRSLGARSPTWGSSLLIMLAYVGLMSPSGLRSRRPSFSSRSAAFFRRPSGVKDWIVIGVFAVVTTVAISLLFGGLFNVNLPDGSWLSRGKGW